MRTLALDPQTGDLALTAWRLTLVEGTEAIVQRLRGRLRLWQGEWFADAGVGVPYGAFLDQTGAAALALAETSARQAIATCPGVAAVEAFAFALERATRAATVTFRVRTTTGEVIEDSGFRLEG
ncbi:hypothetical protein [Luteitalea sp.]|uniref:hypothetical protein n=1 Tax=Luteitalea sp. TaxID=2004800 RepID=UPI0025C559E8|nr:hypothetical protein [Luteitalea sp.]